MLQPIADLAVIARELRRLRRVLFVLHGAIVVGNIAVVICTFIGATGARFALSSAGVLIASVAAIAASRGIRARIAELAGHQGPTSSTW